MGFDKYVDVGGRTVVQYRKQTGDLPRFLFKRENLKIQQSDEPDPIPIAVTIEN